MYYQFDWQLFNSSIHRTRQRTNKLAFNVFAVNELFQTIDISCYTIEFYTKNALIIWVKCRNKQKMAKINDKKWVEMKPKPTLTWSWFALFSQWSNTTPFTGINFYDGRCHKWQKRVLNRAWKNCLTCIFRFLPDSEEDTFERSSFCIKRVLRIAARLALVAAP